jgi:hypothetical protein
MEPPVNRHTKYWAVSVGIDGADVNKFMVGTREIVISLRVFT